MTNVLEWLLAGLLLLLGMVGTTSEMPLPPEVVTPPARSGNTNPAPPALAGAVTESALTRFLSLVPWTEDYREMVLYGDMAGWHEGAGIARLDSFDELQSLPDAQREAWMYGLYSETMPPSALGINYIATQDMRELYGFSFFDVLQAAEAGSPPNGLTLLRVDASPARIHAALTAMGYAVEEMPKGTLYSLRDDYEIEMTGDVFGRLGALNRIFILNSESPASTTLLIGRATEVITSALAADAIAIPALLHDPWVAAIVQEIDANLFNAPGMLSGAIFMGGPIPEDPMAALGQRGEAMQDALRRYGEAPLDAWVHAGFTTHRDGNAVYMTALLAFTPGVDAALNAERLATRMQDYYTVSDQLADDAAWTLHAHGAGGSADVPVAWVTMQVNEARVNREMWMNQIARRDQLYLTPGVPLVPD